MPRFLIQLALLAGFVAFLPHNAAAASSAVCASSWASNSSTRDVAKLKEIISACPGTKVADLARERIVRITADNTRHEADRRKRVEVLKPTVPRTVETAQTPKPTPLTADQHYAAGHAFLTAKDFQNARTEFAEACKGKHGLACLWLGASYVDSNYGKTELSVAREKYKLSCDYGSVEGCDYARYALSDPAYGPVNWDEVIVAFDSMYNLNPNYIFNCKDGDSYKTFCNQLAKLYSSSKYGMIGVEKSYLISRSLCNNGQPSSCDGLGEIITKANSWKTYYKSRFIDLSSNIPISKLSATDLQSRIDTAATSKQFGTLRELLELACDNGSANACVNLGAYFTDPAFGTPDNSRTIALYEKACSLKYAVGCDYARMHYARDNTDISKATTFYNFALKYDPKLIPMCAPDYFAGVCNSFSSSYKNKDRDSVLKQLSLYTSSCNQNEYGDNAAYACDRVQDIYLNSPVRDIRDQFQARVFNTKACKARRLKNC